MGVAADLLAFRRPGLAGLLFATSAAWVLLFVTRRRLQDPSFPPDNFTMAVVALVLPALAVAALLPASWRAEHRVPRRARSAPRPPRVAHQRLRTRGAIGRSR